MTAFDFTLRARPFSSCVALAALLAACSSDKQPARAPSGVTVGAVAAEQRMETTDRSDDNSATVQLSDAIRSRCNVPATAEEAPRFEYDQATLRSRGENILDHVAECLKSGALKDQTVTLVGRADPRGPDSYNQELGRSRAAAARNYLVERGVPAERIRLVSRGEQEARGNNEATWALDRRVDLELGDLSTGSAMNAAGTTSAPSSAGTASAGSESPILEGTRLQIETSDAQKDPHPNAASYADTAEGATPSGKASSGSSSGSGKASASGSVNVQTGASAK